MTTLTVHPDMPQRSDAWYEARRGIITASTVGDLIAEHKLTGAEYACPECAAPAGDPCIGVRSGEPIKTLHTGRTAAASEANVTVLRPANNDTTRGIYATLVAERITGHVEETFTTNDMMRGIMDEPIARNWYAEHTKQTVTECGFMVRDAGAWELGYSPDGLVGDDGLIEIKSRAPKGQVGLWLSGKIPAAHMAQCQAALLVSGRDWIDYVSWCGGMPTFIRRITPDTTWADAITEAVVAFEDTARSMLTQYTNLTTGLPVPERTDHSYLDGVI